MGVIVLVMHDNNVLLGQGGTWREDRDPSVKPLQRSTATSAQDATVEFLGRLPKGTIMKPVVQRVGYFSTKFIETAKPNPPGFIKGGAEVGDADARAAIAREFEEETFTKIPASRFVELEPNVFKLVVTDAEAQAIIDTWKNAFRAGIGELVTLKWMAVSNVRRSSGILNRESKAVLHHLPTSGGRRTRRRMFQKPKTLKKRIR